MALAGQQDAVTLWVPGKKTTSWQEIANFYGVGNEFPIQWLQSRKLLRRMDFAISALMAARRWNADVIYTWMVQVSSHGVVARLSGCFGNSRSPHWTGWSALAAAIFPDEGTAKKSTIDFPCPSQRIERRIQHPVCG